MDKAMIERHLALAREHVMLGQLHLARQRRVISDIQARGGDDALAIETMENFAATQRMHEADKERMECELVAASARVPLR